MIALLAIGLLLLQLTLGANMTLLIHSLTGGDWDFLPETKRLARKLPIALVVVAAHLFFYKQIYPSSDKPWLQPPFFIVRSVVYLFIFQGLSLTALRTTSEVKSAIALIVLFFTSTLATFDWIQSLEPHWSSSIFGVLFLAGGFAGATAFSLLKTHDTEKTLNGNLLLTGAATWAYLTLSQVLVIWMGYVPEKLAWLTKRAEGFWKPVTFVIWALAFLIPLLALLFRDLKRKRAILVMLAAGILISRWLEISNWVFAAAQFQVAVMVLATIVAFASVTALWRFGK